MSFSQYTLESYFEPCFLSLQMTKDYKSLKKELLDWILSYDAVSILSTNYVQNGKLSQARFFS